MGMVVLSAVEATVPVAVVVEVLLLLVFCRLSRIILLDGHFRKNVSNAPHNIIGL